MNAIDTIRGSLPDGILEPRVSKQDISGGFLGIYAVEANDMTLEQLSWFIDDVVSKRLLGVEGMAEVNRFAGVDREIEVILDPQKIQAYGVTASQLNSVLRQNNLDAAGGAAEVGGTRQSVRVLGNSDDAYALSQQQIQLGDGRDSRDVTGNRVGLPCTSGRGKCDVLTLKHTRCVDRIASGWTTVSSRNPLFVTGKPIRTGEEDTDPADQRVPHQVAVGITEQGDAARKGRDASGLRIGKSLGNKPVGLGRIERCHTSGNDRVRDVEPSHQGLVVRCAPHAIRTRMLNAVPIGVLDRKQIDRWSEPNTRREVASQSHRGDESGSAIGRGKCRGQ